MRLLRDGLPFGAIFGAPLTALAREVLLPCLAALGAVSFAGGLFLKVEGEEEMTTWCDCRSRCGDVLAEHDRRGAVCRALPGSWASLHEHRPVPATEPFESTCRCCSYPVSLHAREGEA